MKEKRYLHLLMAVGLSALIVVCCSKNEDEEQSFMTAAVDNVAFNAGSLTSNLINDSITSIVGWKGSEYLSLTLVNALSTGTYDVSLATPSTGAYSNDGQQTFYVSRQGSVEISEYSASRIKGTFEFMAVKSATKDTVYVTSGQFDVARKK